MSYRPLLRLFTGVVLLLASAGWEAAAQGGQGAGPVIRFDPTAVRKEMSGTREELVDVNNLTTFQSHMNAFQQASSVDEQRQIVTDLADYCVQRGLRPAPDLAEVFLSLAQRARDAGRTEDFRRLAGFAETFDSKHPAVHLALAAVAQKQHGFFSGAFFFESLNAFILTFQHPYTRPIAMANLGIWCRIAGFLLLGVLSLLLLMKYQRLFRHDIHEWMGGRDQAWNRAAGWVGLFLPSLLLLAGYWWCVYWAGLLLLYATRSEKAVTCLAVVGLLASGAFALHTGRELYLTESIPHVSNLRSYQNRVDVGGDAYLAALAGSEDPEKETYAFLLANRHLVHGSYFKAEEIYKSLIASQPQNAAVANNLGCILYYEGRYQEALQWFSKAIDAKRDMAIAYFNRSLARTKIFDFTEAKADQEEAHKIDRHFTDVHNLARQEEWGPVPAFLPEEITRDMALAQEAGRVGRTAIPRKPYQSGAALVLRPPFSLIALLLTALFLILSVVKGRDFFSRACFKCGRPFCSRCKTSLEFESFCAQCVHLYIKQDGVSPEARLKKNYEVEIHNRFLRMMRSALSLVAPGAGHFVEGRPFSSLFLLLLWCGLGSAFLLRIFALPLPITVSAAPLWKAFTFAGLLIMAVLWLAFGLPRALSRDIPRGVPEARS